MQFSLHVYTDKTSVLGCSKCMQKSKAQLFWSKMARTGLLHRAPGNVARREASGGRSSRSLSTTRRIRCRPSLSPRHGGMSPQKWTRMETCRHVQLLWKDRGVKCHARCDAPRWLRGIQERSARGVAGNNDTRGHSLENSRALGPRSGHECRRLQPFLGARAFEFRAAHEVRDDARRRPHAS